MYNCNITTSACFAAFGSHDALHAKIFNKFKKEITLQQRMHKCFVLYTNKKKKIYVHTHIQAVIFITFSIGILNKLQTVETTDVLYIWSNVA